MSFHKNRPKTRSSRKRHKRIKTISKLLTLHSTVLATVNGVEFRVLFDRGSSSSYICTKLISALNLKPINTARKIIDQMSRTITKDVKIYRMAIASQTYYDFKIETDCFKAEKDILTHLPNTKIRELRKKYKRLGFEIFWWAFYRAKAPCPHHSWRFKLSVS